MPAAHLYKEPRVNEKENDKEQNDKEQNYKEQNDKEQNEKMWKHKSRTERKAELIFQLFNMFQGDN